jgi:hypothetical protein
LRNQQAGPDRRKRYYSRTFGGEVAEDLFNRGLCLPSDTAINEEHINRIIKVIIGCGNRKKIIEDRTAACAQIRHPENFGEWMKSREQRLVAYSTVKDLQVEKMICHCRKQELPYIPESPKSQARALCARIFY